MACNNALLGRYKVRVAIGCGVTSFTAGTPEETINSMIIANTDKDAASKPGWIYHVTKISGIGLGEDGTIEIPDWIKKTVQADGKRNIPQLGMQFKYMSDKKTFELFAAMFNNRMAVKYDFDIHVTDKKFDTLYYYTYKNCEMLAFNQEDQELGQSKLIYIDTKFTVDDVELYKADGTKLVASSTVSILGAGI